MVKTQRKEPHYVAQDILSRRDHSIAEVRLKLKRKGFSATQTDETIAWLQMRKLLNDEKFAARYVENTLAIKAVGPRWIAYKLKQKGIAQDIIEETLGSVFTTDGEQQLATTAAQAWRRQHSKHREDKQRLQRFLMSRGFSFEAIKTAIA